MAVQTIISGGDSWRRASSARWQQAQACTSMSVLATLRAGARRCCGDAMGPSHRGRTHKVLG